MEQILCSAYMYCSIDAKTACCLNRQDSEASGELFDKFVAVTYT